MAAEDTYSSAISTATNYSSWLIELLGEHLRGDILEVGLGHGGYVERLAARGTYTGVDLDPQAVEAAAMRYPQHTFEAHDITTDRFAQRFGGQFDITVCMNVIEHIADDRSAVANLAATLKPGGTLALVVPAVPALYNDLDRLAGHHRRYTLERLRGATERTPVKLETLKYFNPIGGLGWYVNKLKSYDSLDEDAVNGQIAFFDRYCVPLSRALSPLLANIFGQSALMIAQKQVNI